MLRAFSVQPQARFDPVCISCTLPEHDPEIIFFSDHWKVILHPSQCGLGSVLLSARRHVPRMADLSTEEGSDFQVVLRALEPALERAFGALLVNMQYQRNWAYQNHDPDPPLKDGRPNPHVHWHIMPRYAAPVSFGNVEFGDPTFGEPFEWREQHVPPSVRQAILVKIQQELDITFVD